jgi:hypothetical protein
MVSAVKRDRPAQVNVLMRPPRCDQHTFAYFGNCQNNASYLRHNINRIRYHAISAHANRLQQ